MLALILMAMTGAWAQTIDLSGVTEATTAKNGDVLTGILGANVQISIADKATVTLDGVTINGTNTDGYFWAGITCLGDATITLEGVNNVKGFRWEYPGIYIPDGKTLTIQGEGSLNVSSNGGAGIGGGEQTACGNIVIKGGNINATGVFNSAGIGGSNGGLCGNITITGGNITATSGNPLASSIGAGSPGTCGTVTIGGIIKESSIGSPFHYLSLADDKDNSSTLTTYNNKTSDVTLMRTLQTGGWNTFCAPFNISNSKLTAKGMTVKKLTSSSFDSSTGKLTLNFRDASSIEAGKPYLVEVNDNVVNPTFENITVSNSTTTTETTYADLVPVMKPTKLTGGDKTVLFVSGGNKLTYPTGDGNINGFRADFKLKGAAATARSFSMSFGDEETGIEPLTISTDGEKTEAFPREGWDGVFYDLQGRRIENLPTAKGIYIQNGRKIIIRSATQGDACQSKN